MTRIIVIFLSFLVKFGFPFVDGSQCPSGWLVSGEICIRLFLQPANFNDAQAKCEEHEGILLDCDRQSVVSDVADILNSLFESGLTESTWLVNQKSGTLFQRALSRGKDNTYRLIEVSDLAVFPFVCSLTHADRRSLLFQQLLMSKGSPTLSSSVPSEVYFYPRADADFVALPCVADGNPVPHITWFRNDVEMVTSSLSNTSFLLSGGSLLVPAVPSLAYSSFYCTAKNIHGEVRGPSILLKPAFLDSFRSHRLEVFPLFNGGARLDCDAPAHQPKSLSFLWLYDSSTEKILPQSERIFISFDGTLYFSYVLKEDETSYACSLSLSSTQSGHYGPFFRLSVPSLQPSFPPRLDISQPQIFPENPVAGSTIYLECFAYGNPIPTYKWSRVDEKHISSRATLMNHGRVLKIERTTSSDVGRYKCSAGNAIGVTAGEITVVLRVPPTIIIPLSDRLLSSESEFSLECPLSSADMQSSVEWFKDAKPVVPLLMPPEQRKRFNLDHNILHVTSAKLSDSGVYQCVVSNDVGVSSSSAHIQIKDATPVFPPQAMPTKVFAVKGSILILPCIYQASPRGYARWSDEGGTRLPHRGRVRENRGILTIEQVLDDDAGLFFCSVSNRLGKAHAQIQLIVLDRPKIKVNSDAKFTNEGAVNITCEVELNCKTTMDCPEALFQWTVDDQPLTRIPYKEYFKTKIRQHSHHGQKGKYIKQVDLEVPLKLSGKLGHFACSSLYGGGAVDLLPYSLPPVPIFIRVENYTNNGIRLSWKRTAQNRDTRDHPDGEAYAVYLVEFRTREDRRWKVVPRKIVTKNDADGVIMEKLIPNTDYQFRVRSFDSTSLGDPSPPSEWVHTLATSPVEVVKDLRWRPLDSKTLLIEWEPIEKNHNSGDHLRYRVSWSVANTEHSKPSSPPFHAYHIETKSSQAVLKLNSSEGCRIVALAVRPVNDQGEGSTSTDTMVFINSKGRLRQIYISNAYSLNATHVNISWMWEDDGECQTVYAVQASSLLLIYNDFPISCKSASSEAIVVSVPSEFSDWIIGGLIPDSEYECILKPFDRKGNYGNQSAVVRILTKQRPPTMSPKIKKLTLKPLDNDSGYTTILEWSSVSFGAENNTDDTTGYKIFIYISETASEAVMLTMPVYRLIDRDRPSARLDGLKLMYMYTIQVAGYNSGGLGPLSPPRVIRLGSQSTVESSSNNIKVTLILLISALLSG